MMEMKWVATWSYLPIEYGTSIGTVENLTQRTFFWNNLNGKGLQLMFSNMYGSTSLVLDKVVVAKHCGNALTDAVVMTYHGSERIELAPGEMFESDEKAWDIRAGEEIVVSVYIRERTEVSSGCSTWSAKSWHTVYHEGGDWTEEFFTEGKQSREIYPYVEADVNKSNIVVGVSAIRLKTEDTVRTIALFGDSITHMSYFADALCRRLYQSYPGELAIVNRGIGGNRVLHDATYVPEIPGNGKCFGTAGIQRFEQDVFGRETPDTLLILEGVNDLMHPYFFRYLDEVVTADQLSEAYSAMTQIAHRHGTKVYLGTVMPFRDDNQPFLPEAEKVRLELNERIRSNTEADGIIDYAKLLSQEDEAYLLADCHIGDGLHPNTQGGELMASEAIRVLGME